ncbi:hypothetical protein CYLTODRAFT_489543 [Cylindrobasidium torrendii FP15055 ss-10]|uniref:F-box domain-containing protein n=1 Tax=Cylindrobasidium torrendii FP15055 ss-10 TaxID=1314674 RepID=A0A0D7BDX0_9AGAR|nr:hypothetical protein CYLTODRAFT_489543 [Cylindrobasidium torrendii FP15055 ss-10]
MSTALPVLSLELELAMVAHNNAHVDPSFPSSASVADVLPQELLDHIIDLLAEDGTAFTSLISCSLVCRAFLPRTRKHIFRMVYLGAKAHSRNLITTSLAPRTLFFVQDLTINFASDMITPLVGPPRASNEVGRWIPTSFDDFPMLETLILMNMAWSRQNANEKLLNYLTRGPHHFRTLGLTGLRFPDNAHVCALVRAAPQLNRLVCVGVDFDADAAHNPLMSCAEHHTWDQLEVLNVYPGSLKPILFGTDVEGESGLLKAILDPSQCPAALPALHTINWFVEQTQTAPLNKLLSMTCSTLRTLNIVMYSMPGSDIIELTHLAHVRFDLSEWDGARSDGVEAIHRVVQQLQRDVPYALQSLELRLSKAFRINSTPGFKELWEVLDESLACRTRFPFLSHVELHMSGTLDLDETSGFDFLPAFRTGKSMGSAVLSGPTMHIRLPRV